MVRQSSIEINARGKQSRMHMRYRRFGPVAKYSISWIRSISMPRSVEHGRDSDQVKQKSQASQFWEIYDTKTNFRTIIKPLKRKGLAIIRRRETRYVYKALKLHNIFILSSLFQYPESLNPAASLKRSPTGHLKRGLPILQRVIHLKRYSLFPGAANSNQILCGRH